MNVKENRKEQIVLKATWVSLVVNIFLAIIKVAFGIIGKSQVVIADGIHSISDLSTDIAIIIGVRYWSKPADEDHPHGHYRIETIVTLSIGIILAIVATGIFSNAVFTIDTKTSQPEWIAFIATVVSVIIKEAIYQWTHRLGKKIKSMPLMANAWHHRTDAISSIPAMIAVVVAIINPDWIFIDNIGAILIAVFIYYTAFKIIYPNLSKLVDSGAPEPDIKIIEDIISQTDGVLSVHKIRTRYTGCSNLAVDCHIEVDPNITVWEGHKISELVRANLLDSELEISDVITHIEPFHE